MKVKDLLLETYNDELVLQKLGDYIANKFLNDSEFFNKKIDIKLKDFVPSSLLSHLYNRLSNYQFHPIYRSRGNIGGFHNYHKSPTMRYGAVYISDNTDIDDLKKDIVHELKHALHNSKSAKSDKNFNSNYNIKNKYTKKYDDSRNLYLSQHTEILSRFSEAISNIKRLIDKADIESISNKDIQYFILSSMDTNKLMHIFKTSNEYVGDKEELEFFNRHTPRIASAFAPHDNKYFRQLFKKMYEFAIKYIKSKKGT